MFLQTYLHTSFQIHQSNDVLQMLFYQCHHHQPEQAVDKSMRSQSNTLLETFTGHFSVNTNHHYKYLSPTRRCKQKTEFPTELLTVLWPNLLSLPCCNFSQAYLVPTGENYSALSLWFYWTTNDWFKNTWVFKPELSPYLRRNSFKHPNWRNPL